MPAWLLIGALLAAGSSSMGAQAVQAPAAPAAKPAAALPSARSIIDRHVAAIGGREAILKHSSSHATGTMAMPSTGLSGALELYSAKPNRMLMRITFPGVGEVVEGFDGQVGWSLSAMTGPALSQGKVLEEKKFDSDFYSELHESSRYDAIETVEKTTFDGRDCYKIRLVRKGGGEDIQFYDVATGLRAGMAGSRETPMGAIASTQTLSGYRKFGDILQPTTMKIASMGMEQVITIESVEYDKVDPAVFEPPAQIKALIK